MRMTAKLLATGLAAVAVPRLVVVTACPPAEEAPDSAWTVSVRPGVGRRVTRKLAAGVGARELEFSARPRPRNGDRSGAALPVRAAVGELQRDHAVGGAESVDLVLAAGREVVHVNGLEDAGQGLLGGTSRRGGSDRRRERGDEQGGEEDSQGRAHGTPGMASRLGPAACRARKKHRPQSPMKRSPRGSGAMSPLVPVPVESGWVGWGFVRSGGD